MVGGVTALALLAGVGCGLGITFVVLGVRGSGHRAERSKLVNWRGDQHGGTRIAVAAGVGLVVAAVTRWPVAGVLVAALVGSWHTLFGQQLSASAEVARIEAIAGWTEMLRDTMAAAAGLEQAITSTAAIAPKPIRAEVVALATRLETREVTLTQGLPDLADALGDPTADLVVAALSSAAERRARSLGDLLGALAASAREDANMRLRVQASRARVRTAARIVTCVTLLMAGGLVLFKRDFLSPYGSAEGQVVLTVVGVIFATAFWWLTRMSEVSSPERFLTAMHTRGAEVA
jgi:Flp pilus assembly protein TadB